jgi:S-adenosyl methyltransferase
MTVPELDASRPNLARVLSYLTRGRDGYSADRAEADRLLQIVPQLRDLALGNRAFLERAITWAARQGVA